MKLKLKGVNDGVVVFLPDCGWEGCCSLIYETIKETPGFFDGSNFYLDAGNKDIRVAEIQSLRDGLYAQSIHLKGIISTSEKTARNCMSLGILTQPESPRVISRKQHIEVGVPEEKEKPCGNAYITRTVHSGMVVSRSECIVINGDVNAGAEVYSDEDVIVWGIVRGKVTAGRNLAEGSCICALGFEDAQLFINSEASYIKKSEKKGPLQPLVARVENGEIVIKTRGRRRECQRK